MPAAFSTKRRRYRHVQHHSCKHAVIVAIKAHVHWFIHRNKAKEWLSEQGNPEHDSIILTFSKPEQWRNIVGYPGYQVSSYGRVKSLPRIIYRGSTKVHIQGRILKQSCMPGGYLKVDLHRQGQNKQYPVDELVADAFIPNFHGYHEVRHLNEEPLDNRVSNLKWMSRKQVINYGHRTQKTFKAVCLWQDSDKSYKFPSIKSASEWLKKKEHLSVSALSLSKSISRVASPNTSGTTVHGYCAKRL